MENDLISRVELRRQLAIWCEKLRSAGECGGCEVELLQAVIKMVDAQATASVEPYDTGITLSTNDLISRSALIQALRRQEKVSELCADGLSAGLARAIVEVYNAKIVDAELVRRGKWRLNPNGIYDDNTWECSVCGGPWKLIDGNPGENFMRYCPQCGAKME